MRPVPRCQRTQEAEYRLVLRGVARTCMAMRFDVLPTIDLFPLSDCHPTDNFIVGLTDVSPLAVVPSLWNYDVCGQFPGVVVYGGTVFQPCIAEMPPRRYLIIQIERANGVLNFCEVEVFTRSKLISVSSYSSPVQEVKFLASLDDYMVYTTFIATTLTVIHLDTY